MRIAWMAVTAGLLGAAAGAFGAMRTATRLDRLHVRTDAAWAALDAALYRRALTVSALESSVALRRAAHAAMHARPSAREDLENELCRLLSALDRRRLAPASASKLADAEQRVVIARRVYHDAVRDTLALRSHRLVRWLRLAGTAPLPRYFEIAEPTLTNYELELDGAGA
jgi:hypothetical protein